MWSIGWTWDPVILAGLAASLYLYVVAAARFRPRARQVLQFVGGLALVFVALVSPLHVAADRYLFTLHVVQHMLLQMAAAPLLVLGLPAGALAQLYEHPVLRRLLRWVWSPVPAAVVYNAVLAFWHLPLAIGGPRLTCGIATDLPLQVSWVASLQHVLPVGAGVWFWGAVLLPPPFSSAGRGIRLAALGGTWVFNWLVSFVNTLAGQPLYGTYFAAPRLFGVSPLADQVVGAGILWEHGNMVYAVAVVAQVRSLLQKQEVSEPGGSLTPRSAAAGPLPQREPVA